MAATRTGVYIDDFLDETGSLPAELQRLLSTMRELDERAAALQRQILSQAQLCLEMPPAGGGAGGGGGGGGGGRAGGQVEGLRREVKVTQDKHLGLCTEKVLLAQQAHELLEGHERRLGDDLTQFESDLRQVTLPH